MERVMFLLMILLAILAFGGIGCNDVVGDLPIQDAIETNSLSQSVDVDQASVNTPVNEWKMLKESTSSQSLLVKSWKLFDVVSNQRDCWIFCNENITYRDINAIEFKEDGTITAYSCFNEFYGTYTMITRGDNVFCSIRRFGGTKVGGPDLWWDTYLLIKTFTVQENELRLFYNDGKNCLVFKSL